MLLCVYMMLTFDLDVPLFRVIRKGKCVRKKEYCAKKRGIRRG